MATRVQYGITPAFADLLLESLRGIRTNIATVCAQLHDGDPGAQGINNPSAITTRQPLTFTAPDNGATALSGGSPTWSVGAGETLRAISLWSGPETDPTAVCLFTLPLSVATPIAEGDVVVLGTCHLEWWDAANKIWPQLLTITAGTAAAQALAPVPTLVASSILPVPPANANASALTPTVFLGTIVAAPLAPGSASAFVPTIDLDMVIAAPTAMAAAAALPAIPSTAITAPTASANGSALAATVSGTAAIAAPVAHGSSAALVPTVSAVSGVAYGAAAAGTFGSGTSFSLTQTVTGNAIYLAANVYRTASAAYAATVGGVAMSQVALYQSYFNGSGNIWDLVIFELLSPPTGSQTINFTITTAGTTFAALDTVSFNYVVGVGTAQTATGSSNAVSQTVTGAQSGGAILQVIGNAGASSAFGSYSASTVWAPASNGSLEGILIGYTLTSSTSNVTLTATRTSGSNNWGSLALPLNP